MSSDHQNFPVIWYILETLGEFENWKWKTPLWNIYRSWVYPRWFGIVPRQCSGIERLRLPRKYWKHIWHAGKLPIFMANIHPLKERILCIWHLTRKYRSSVRSGFHSLQAIDEVPCKGHGVNPWAPVGNQYGLTSWQSLSYLVPNTSNRFKQVYIRYKWLK